ncbi:DNA-binding response regulator, OmpR family, contains REC and winged-helix (wHTH) domain [Lachnospiraceae bacterium C7]|nr:DNA-binding response regulator, OmpR family, contains REC and winged-helix (wHTH) domain [Lachnospiraceae bacterium C7]
MKKIIIVEDDINLRKELKQLLETSGYEVFLIENFKNIQEKIVQENADLVLLDINLPNVNGEIVLKELRKQSAIPVIMVTSRTSEVDEVLSLSYGADDYVTKPYNPTLLLLRIGAVLKRYDSTAVADELYYKDVKVNVAKGTLQRKEQEVSLTKNEMLIFLLLLENQNKIVSRNVIMTNLWDNDEFLNDNALTVNISRLRGKLKELGYEDVIETKKKQGYILI